MGIVENGHAELQAGVAMPVESSPATYDTIGRPLQEDAHASRRGRLTLAGLQLAGGLYFGSVLGSHYSCVESDAGTQPVTVCSKIDLLHPLQGGTVGDLGQNGLAKLQTHHGPVHISIRAKSFEPGSHFIQTLAKDPAHVEKTLISVGNDLSHELPTSVEGSLERAAIFFMLGNISVWAAGPLYESLKRRKQYDSLYDLTTNVRWGAAVGLSVALTSGGLMYTTQNKQALKTAQLSGPIAQLEPAIGNIQAFWDRYQTYSEQLSEKARNASVLFRLVSNLDVEPRSNTLRVLVVSDIHCNIGVLQAVAAVVRNDNVDVVSDAGDDTDSGTDFEHLCSKPLNDFKDKHGKPVKVLWVKGVHEDDAFADYMRTLPNVQVLDNETTTVQGVRFIGKSDPRFVGEQGSIPPSDSPLMQQFRSDLLKEAIDQGAKVVLLHDNVAAEYVATQNNGAIGTVIAGHTHRRSDQHIGNTYLHIEGTTGAGGPKAIINEISQEATFSTLDIDTATGQVVGGTLFTINGFGQETQVTVQALPLVNQGDSKIVQLTPQNVEGR